MHNELAFPIECSYQQVIWAKYSVGQEFLSGVSTKQTTYEAMNNLDLIPTLATLVENTNDNRRLASIKKWVKEYGLLTSPNRYIGHDQDWKRENTESFWTAAKKIAGLWNLYKEVTNRDLEEMKRVVLFIDEREDDSCERLVTIFNSVQTSGHVFLNGIQNVTTCKFSNLTSYLNVSLEEIDKDPLLYYQYTAFNYLRKSIESELKGIALISKEIQKVINKDQDLFKTTPIIEPTTLLQAMYLQFYILLNSSNKKVCENCSRIFYPDRRDQLYCSSACKNTAKSRRYRRKKEE